MNTLIACLTLLSASAAVSQDATVRAPRRPNVLVVLADDLGWTDLGCQGSTFYETPHLDALAASGMRFTQAYAACCVCSPTRAALLTGKSPARMDTTDWFGGRRKGALLPAQYHQYLPLEEVTLAEALKEAGYRTGFFGKWHLGGEGYHPEDQGFEHNVAGHYRGSPPGGYFSPYENPKLSDGPEGEHLPARLADEAIAWMAEVRDEPFLLYLSFYSVHTPLQTTDELKAKYERKRAALPKNDAAAWGQERERKVRYVQDHAVYAGMVQSMDASVGRVLAKLDALGLTDDTLVVFTSDNGGLSTSEGHPTSNLPLRAGKGWNYEGGIREPFLVRWPGVAKPGSVCDVPVISMDLYPTVLEVVGLAPRPRQHVDGASFAPLLRGEREIAPRPLTWHYPHYGNQGGAPSAAIRDGKWKLVEWFEDGSLELFDLERDVGELLDVAKDEPEITARLHAHLVDWRLAVGAKMPTTNPDHER